MNPIIFEQIRDKVKEVGVAHIINDKLIELHFIDHKEKMAVALDEIKTRQKLIYTYITSRISFLNGESFSWYKEGMSWCSWTNSGCNIELRTSAYNVSLLQWRTPTEIQHHKSDKLKSFCSPWIKTERGWRDNLKLIKI